MTTPETHTAAGTVAPTAWLVELTEAGTTAARWVLGTEETGIGFFGEDALHAPGASASAVPNEDVADWVAEYLEVTGVELAETGDGRWSVGITS
jgi:hypothetical protein